VALRVTDGVFDTVAVIVSEGVGVNDAVNVIIGVAVCVGEV
jgi:hypothetical protein